MLLLFQSTRAVIAAEKIIRAEYIECQIVPVPKTISSECGMGIRIDAAIEERVCKLLADFSPGRYPE
jgi:hypothetical protein